MEFEWDEAKSERTRLERGFGFDAAVSIFEGPVLEWEDRRQDWGETRILAVGSVGKDVLAVIYTDRSSRRRIISARKARKKEREAWRLYVALLKTSGA
ncbi:MAG: BrnT family toxin [Rhizobiales bacterium]|nr:BrnT family toxin [Hyphomicrobiales bacterium]MBI3674759.1 BrnT family toxin [Hyphomicrobiales bacterium]